MGTQIFYGIINIETINGDYTDTITNPDFFKKSLLPVAPLKKYFHQKYEKGNSEYDRIPDFRNQLLWMPDVSVKDKKVVVDFFTSDVTGDFEISLEGFTENGKSVTSKAYFKVE
ncbi:hypothetical protein GCM10022393_35770 [Aquimarina addita]|uniref:Uncharacterized protein n=1 Tax=Aquimarina addita TaxID=870485 RepID=A0ABP6UUU0_9FLAO